MQISRPSPNQLMWGEQWSSGRKLFSGAGLILFALATWQIASAAQRIEYRCDRISSHQARCQRLEKGYLGLVIVDRAYFETVTAATAAVEIQAGRDDPYELHSVVLTTAQGRMTLVEPPLMRAGRRGNPAEMAAIAVQINRFLDSHDSRWQLVHQEPDFWWLVAIVGFMTVFVSGAIIVVAREMGPVTYTLARHYRSAAAETFTFTRQDRWGQRQIAFSWGDVVTLEVVKTKVGGKHRRTVYCPRLQLRHPQAIALAEGGDQLQAEALIRAVKQFLRSQPPTRLPESDLSGSLEQTLLNGEIGRYTTTGTPAVPSSELPKVRQAAADLRQLGGRYLGDLRCSKFPSVTAYVYYLPSCFSYGLIYQQGWFGGIDYYTTLSNGGSLTTTSRCVIFIPWGRSVRHWRSHIGIPAQPLHQHHRAHLRQLSRQGLLIQNLLPSLTAVAQAMDDHFSDRQGILIGL